MPIGFLRRDAEIVGCKGLEWKEGSGLEVCIWVD